MAISKRHLDSLAQMLRVLGDATRLKLVAALQDGEHNVTYLCGKMDLPQPTVSRHLGVLRLAGFVNARRDGREVYYSIRASKGDSAARAISSLAAKGKALRIGSLLLGMER